MGNFNLQKSKSVIKKLFSYRIWIQAVALLALLPTMTHAQYFQSLFDCDSTQDWALDIFLKPDSTYYTFSSSFNDIYGKWYLSSMTISTDGHTVLNKKIIKTDYYYPFPGNSGEVRKLPSGNYISPISLVNPNVYYSNSKAGFIKLTPIGDTVFMKTYYDTSIIGTWLYCTTVLPNGHILGGGGEATNGADYGPGLVICADTLGDTLWTKTYLIDTGHITMINTLEPLDSGRILVGATRDTRVLYDFSQWIDFHAPWFLIIDTNGNILKDTLYSYTNYWEILNGNEGGHLYKDTNGGFYHYGNTSTINVLSDLNDLHNAPPYFAHLDSNFRITWIDSFTYSSIFGKRLIFKIFQSADSCYLLAGSYVMDSIYTNGTGWLMKINKDGGILWERSYIVDSNESGGLFNLLDRPDGSLVLIGSNLSDTMATWHDYEDVWLVGVDSSGCNVGGGCWPTETREMQVRDGDISVYPNPTTGNLTALSTQAGSLEVYTVTGQLTGRYLISAGVTTLQLPGVLASGVYIGSFRPEGGGKPSNIRIVLRP